MDRLDARPCVCAYVSNALLRRVAGRRRAPYIIPQRIPAAGHASRTSLSLSRRHFIRPGHRQARSQESQPGPDYPHHGTPRGGDICLRPALPPAGISHCLGVGSMDRSVSGRHIEHHRPLDDSDGALMRTGSLDWPPALGRRRCDAHVIAGRRLHICRGAYRIAYSTPLH